MLNQSYNGRISGWQTLPADLLLLIVRPLITGPRASYIPLTLTHVCRRWRRAITGLPSLWAFVDTARGKELTKLWLVNSGSISIDVRLWQPPQHVHHTHELPSNAFAAVEVTKQHTRRWRTLDLSFWCGKCMTETIMALASEFREKVALDSLTLGPMGKSNLLSEDLDRSAARRAFKGLQFEPAILRMDSYPIDPLSSVFSTRLTVIEFFSRPLVIPELADWVIILRSTPNLASLALWHPGCQWSLGTPIRLYEPVSLPCLQYLCLSFKYLELITSISSSPLPKLAKVIIDAGWDTFPGRYLSQLAKAAPHLPCITLSGLFDDRISSVSWTKTLSQFRFLKRLTIFETNPSVVEEILAAVGQFESLTELRLDRMSVDFEIDWPGARISSETRPVLTAVGYNDSLCVYSSDHARQYVCLGNFAEEYPGSTYDRQEPGVSIRQDLALVRGATTYLNNDNDNDVADAFDAGNGAHDLEHTEDLDYVAGDTSDEESDSDSTLSDLSLASGDLQVIAWLT